MTTETWNPDDDRADRRPTKPIIVRTNGTTEEWSVEDDLADRRPEPHITVSTSGLSEDDTEE